MNSSSARDCQCVFSSKVINFSIFFSPPISNVNFDIAAVAIIAIERRLRAIPAFDFITQDFFVHAYEINLFCITMVTFKMTTRFSLRDLVFVSLQDGWTEFLPHRTSSPTQRGQCPVGKLQPRAIHGQRYPLHSRAKGAADHYYWPWAVFFLN